MDDQSSQAETPSSLKVPHQQDAEWQDLALNKAQTIVRRVWGFAGLRPLQKKVLMPVLQGRDTLAVLPTGSGKSLCYSLPALMGPGLVIVVSPLIALIRDQVIKLRQQKVAAAALDSMQTSEERKQVLTALDQKRVKILFVSPERFSQKNFRLAIDPGEVRMIAIDEAHCISQWGFHFRPEYRKLQHYLKDFPGAVRLALTATTTKQVRREIGECLNLRDPHVFVAPPARENLSLKVRSFSKLAELQSELVYDVLAENGSGIIYCPTRRKVSELYAQLKSEKVEVVRYHAGLLPWQRERAQQDFLSGKARVAVATNAFGMGIDKSDIRFVYHFGLPQSLEHYLQEVGRAGRDGKESLCRLYFNRRDYHIQKFIIEKSFLDTDLLRSCLRKCEDIMVDEKALPLSSVVEHLDRTLKLGKETSEKALRILYRQGLFSMLEEASRNYESGQSLWIFRNPGKELEKQFFDTYPKTKAVVLDRLKKMLSYAEAGRARQKILDQYFS